MFPSLYFSTYIISKICIKINCQLRAVEGELSGIYEPLLIFYKKYDIIFIESKEKGNDRYGMELAVCGNFC